MSTNSGETSRRKTTRQDATTTDRIARSAHEMIDETANRAKSVEENLRERAREAGDRVDESQDAAMRTVRDTTARAEAFAQERPLAAAGIAFAAGALTAAILRR